MSVFFLVVAGCLLASWVHADTFTAVATIADFVLAEDKLVDALELCIDMHAANADDDVSR